MTDQPLPPEIDDFYRRLSMSEGARANIAQMREVAMESHRWRRIAGALAMLCVIMFAVGVVSVLWDATPPQITDRTNETKESKESNEAVGTKRVQYEMIAVRIHRDRCGKCQKMGDVFAELQHDLDGRPILFLTFDVTDDVTTSQSLLLGDTLAISQSLQGIESGNIVLLDRDGGFIDRFDGLSSREYLANQIAMRL